METDKAVEKALDELGLSGGKAIFYNETDLPDEFVQAEIERQAPQLLSRMEIATLDEWVGNTTGSNRPGGVFSQDKYVAPDSVFAEFKLAAAAARDDDIVSNAVETTEQLAFKRIDIESSDTDEDSVYTQIKDDMDLERRMREIWRELFILSQCYVACIWHRKDFKSKADTASGKKSKKMYSKLNVPVGLTLLDPCKVIPVGNFMFGQERLVYIADEFESASFKETLAGKNSSDMVVNQLIEAPFEPGPTEISRLQELTGAKNLTGKLFLLKQENVWRITSTRPHYQVFADVRLRSVFELLDMKHNLREMDRADILGSLNAIILIKKGDKDNPATARELQNTAMQVRKSARVPMFITDHRIEIEIVTRKNDNVLRPERYNNLDSRITSRLFQIGSYGNYSSGTATDNSPGLFKVIASTMEARRDNIREAITDRIFDEIFIRNDKLTSEPRMNFYPRRIALDFDPKYSQLIFDLFALDQISHETILSEMDINLAEEAFKKRKEEKEYGDVFTPPGEMQSTGNPAVDGRLGGGNKNGGGDNQRSYSPSPNEDSSEEAEK